MTEKGGDSARSRKNRASGRHRVVNSTGLNTGEQQPSTMNSFVTAATGLNSKITRAVITIDVKKKLFLRFFYSGYVFYVF